MEKRQESVMAEKERQRLLGSKTGPRGRAKGKGAAEERERKIPLQVLIDRVVQRVSTGNGKFLTSRSSGGGGGSCRRRGPW